VVGFTLFYLACCLVAIIRCRRELQTARVAHAAQSSTDAVLNS
jgi:hypothetical protein